MFWAYFAVALSVTFVVTVVAIRSWAINDVAAKVLAKELGVSKKTARKLIKQYRRF